MYNRAYADMIVVMRGEATEETLTRSRGHLEDALAIYRELGDTGGEGNILWGLGSFFYFTADAATAEDWFRRSLDLHRAAGHRTMEAWSLHMLTLAQAGQRHWDEARDTGRHALQHFYEAGDISGVTLVLDDLAIIAVADDDRVMAGRLWGAARQLQRTTGTALADYVEQSKELFGVPTPLNVLAPDELERTSAEGVAMGLDELVAYALGRSDGAVPDAHRELDR